VPEFDFEEWTIEHRVESTWISNSVPFSPEAVWVMSPLRTMIAGVSDDYRFEIHHPDGRITEVVRDWEPVGVRSEERDWYKARATANMRGMAPGWVWNGREVPHQKPAYDEFWSDSEGRIWVRRQGLGINLEGCDPDPEERAGFRTNPCWKQTFTLDVFDHNGRFLGPVEAPDDFDSMVVPYIMGNTLLVAVEDEDGTPFVKRYRLVVSGN
jgi:hypothetical protein